mgnify:CR=1 FL=1
MTHSPISTDTIVRIGSIEVRYLMDREWALDAEDILWRRTKLGLKLSATESSNLARFMTKSRGVRSAHSWAVCGTGMA